MASQVEAHLQGNITVDGLVVRRPLATDIDVKNAESIGVSVFETLFETPRPGVSAF